MDFFSPRCLLLAGVILLLQRGDVRAQLTFTGETISMYEDLPVGSTLKELAASGGTTYTYAFGSGTAAPITTNFEVVPTTAAATVELKIKTGASFDPVGTPTYSFEIEAVDSTPSTATGTFTVSVLADIAPTFAVNPYSFTICAVTAGSMVGSVSASDASLASYAIAAGGNSFTTFTITKTDNLGVITVGTGKEANLTTYVLIVDAVDAAPTTGSTTVVIQYECAGAAANIIGFLTIIGAIMLHVVKFI